MQIQPITAFRINTNYKSKNFKKYDEPQIQPNFKGINGFLKGGAVGAGITAAGVTLVAGIAALPLFLGYIAINGAIAGATGHLIEKQNSDKE